MNRPRESGSESDARVAVTGMGLITALGCGCPVNAVGFREGRRAFRRVTLFDVSRQRASEAAEVDLPPRLPRTRLTTRQEARLDRAARLLVQAAAEAWETAGWESGIESLPLVLGTTSAGMALGEAFYRRAATVGPRGLGQARRVVHYQAQRQALDLMDAFDFEGPVTIIANACASGANAVGRGFDLIRGGRASRVLAGGYDALSHLVFAGFDALQALSRTGCRPFAADRDGLALGEGAAVFCLERPTDARRRGATIIGEIAGYGHGTDLHHLTQPHPGGLAALECMKAACRQAGVAPGSIGYVNAHGTGTPLNDSAEAAALLEWGGSEVSRIPVSSTKTGIGHLLGAAGAVEVAVCLLALRGQWLPPQIDTGVADPVCRFPLVTRPREGRLEMVLSNSFGFGGANASLVIRR